MNSFVDLVKYIEIPLALPLKDIANSSNHRLKNNRDYR